MRKIELIVLETKSVELFDNYIRINGRWHTPQVRLPDIWTSQIVGKNSIARVDVFGDYLYIPKDRINFYLPYKWPTIIEEKSMTLVDWKEFKNKHFPYYNR